VPTAPHHLLVIDDEPFIGRMIAMQFGRGPFLVSTAADGPAGLAFLRSHPDIALVVVDVNLPGGMSGLDVMAEAQTDSAVARIPFVVLTASGQKAHMDRAHALGAAALVTKPFSPSKLYRQVCALLGERAAEED
jgi:two-component system OmpR family response regulator